MTTDASAAGPGGPSPGADTSEGAEGRVYNVGGQDWDEVVRAAQEAGDKTDTEAHGHQHGPAAPSAPTACCG